MDQSEYDILMSYLLTSNVTRDYTENQKDTLKRKAKRFLVKNGLLYHKDKKINVDLQAI